MTFNTLHTEIEEAVPKLLDLARELTYSSISTNCKFILTEIKSSQENFHVQRQIRKKENDRKIPVSLSELMPTLENHYNDMYDINLHVYRATEKLTIVDFRYYPKSLLDPDYRLSILENQPMLHCSVAQPPWLTKKKEKFDINWEHYEGLNRLRYIWMRLKSKTLMRLTWGFASWRLQNKTDRH